MKRKKIIIFTLSILFTLFFDIGTSFIIYENLSLFKKGYNIVFFLILFLIIYKLILFVFHLLEGYHSEDKVPSKLNSLYFFFEKNTFWVSFASLIGCFLIYMVAFYPAILSPDPSFQILQYFGIDNKYSYYSTLIDSNVIMTNHHPIFHTLLLGACVKIGEFFRNTNLGLFIYSIFQTTILASTLSYTLCFMKKMNVNKNYILICLMIYALTPVFPFYAMSPVKDVIFSCLIIHYIIILWNYIKTNEISLLKTIPLLLLIMLFRNNGFHILILSLPFLFFTKKKMIKIGSLCIITLTFYFTYNSVILPFFHITPGSIREVLSIPFQQTARYVTYYDVTKKEKKAIDKILEYKTIKKRYLPEKADPVKNKYNPYATKRDLKNYFDVWFEMLKKHPDIYLEATLQNTYGYFYPLKTNWYIYTNEYKEVLNNNGFDYHFNHLSTLRIILIIYGVIFPYIPGLGLIVNIGFSTWLLLFMISYLIYKKKYKEIIPYTPMIIVFLVCLASPVNTYFRYAMPNIFVMPMMIGIFLRIINPNIKTKNNS